MTRQPIRQPIRQHPVSTTAPRRLPTAGLLCAAALVVGVAVAWARTPQPQQGNSTRRQVEHRLREGTEIVEQLGHFRMTGDRVTFFTDDGQGRYVGLENLNLERITRTIADDPGRLQWIVTGTVTEYCGNNFIFVRRAVLKSRTRSLESGI